MKVNDETNSYIPKWTIYDLVFFMYIHNIITDGKSVRTKFDLKILGNIKFYAIIHV